MKPAIVYLKGDATQPKTEGNKIIAHICNDIGGWGKGFAGRIDQLQVPVETVWDITDESLCKTIGILKPE